MFERFTTEAKESVRAAAEEAQALGHRPVRVEHLLLGVLREGRGPAAAALREAGVDLVATRRQVAARLGGPGQFDRADAEALRAVGVDLDAVLARIAALGDEDPAPGRTGRRRPARFAKPTRKALELSLREAIHRKDRSISSAHLLLGVLREGGADAVLRDLGVEPQGVRSDLVRRLAEAA